MVITGTDAKVFELDSNKDVLLNFELPESVNLTVNPTLEVQFAVSVVGSGDGDVDFELETRYVAPGSENLDKTVDETLTLSPTVTDTLARLHTMTFTFDGSLMAAGDGLTMKLENLGTGSYGGKVGVIRNAKFVYRIG